MEQNMVSANKLFLRRIGAFIIDYVIIMFIVFFLFSRSLFSSAPDTSDPFSYFPFFMLAAAAGFLFKDIFFGRSVGKLLLGLCVRDAADANNIPGLHRLVFRNLFIFIWPVELIVSANNIERRRLGDKLAKTQVIAAGKRSGFLIAVIIVLAAALSFSSLFLLVTQTIKNDGSYKTAAEYIQSDNDILSVTGTISGTNLSSGSVNYSNGFGSADLKIYVDGQLRDITVRIELTKEPGSDWIIENISY